ncbi:MAG: DUF1801 domain-containing protein [Acidobacteria bacterium]|nr:DUF1801 domain-containing protein [Acidobacteriota bacterium]
MAELKTRESEESVDAFIESIEDEPKLSEARAICHLMREVTGEEPKMWGGSIVGFGQYHYKYESGREGDWFLTGFSPRKQNLSLYIMAGFDQYDELMKRLGKHRTGKSCLYIKTLDDVDETVLRELISRSVEHMRQMY